MKLEAGKAKYRLPELSEIRLVLVSHGMTDTPTTLEPLEIERFSQVVGMNRRNAAGRPVFYCHDGVDIHLYPVPDRAGTLTVRYLPPEETA